MNRTALFFRGNSCPELPDGTLVADVWDGVVYPSMSTVPLNCDGDTNRLEIAERHIARQKPRLVTGPDLVGRSPDV